MDERTGLWILVGRWMTTSALSDALVSMSAMSREVLNPDENNPQVGLLCDGLTAASASLERSREEMEATLDQRMPEWREEIGQPKETP